MDCQNKDDKPFIQISSNLENPDTPCEGPIMTLGTKSNVHFQSLLPTEMLFLEFDRLKIETSMNKSNNILTISTKPVIESVTPALMEDQHHNEIKEKNMHRT